MKIQKARRFNKVDYPDAPDWMDEIFQVLNTQFETIVTILQNNVTFGENVRSELVTLDVTDDTSVPIRMRTLKSMPIGVFILATNYFDYPLLAWQPSQSEDLTVDVKVKWDTTPSDVVRTTLLFVGN